MCEVIFVVSVYFQAFCVPMHIFWATRQCINIWYLVKYFTGVSRIRILLVDRVVVFVSIIVLSSVCECNG